MVSRSGQTSTTQLATVQGVPACVHALGEVLTSIAHRRVNVRCVTPLGGETASMS
jgi:hypothetical protein